MSRADELYPSFGNGPRRDSLQLVADLIYYDHLRHVILHRFDHHPMLLSRVGNLHPPRSSDSGMGDVAITTDLVGGVHNYHPLLLSQDASHLSKQSSLTHTGASQ